MEDSRGILRGSCKDPFCDCPGYTRGDKSFSLKCQVCLHPPGVHDRLQAHSTSAKTLSTKRSKRNVSEKSPSSRRVKGYVPEVSETPAAPSMSSRVPKTVSTRRYGRVEKSPAQSASSSYRHQAEHDDFEQLQQDPSIPVAFGVRRQHSHFPSMQVAGPKVTDDFGTSVDLVDLDGTGFARSFDRSMAVSEYPTAETERLQAWPSSQEGIQGIMYLHW